MLGREEIFDDATKEKISKLAEAVLAARRNHPQSTLADLYDPLTMPPDLRKAHTALDLAVDRLYRKEPFETDRARVEFLLARYEQITAPRSPLQRKSRSGGRISRAPHRVRRRASKLFLLPSREKVAQRAG